MTQNIKTNNHKAWESLYCGAYASGGSFLPAWGVHGSGKNLTDTLLRPHNKTILEIGCGTGESVEYLKDKRVKHYTGIDISEAAIVKARSRHHENNISFLKMDMSKPLLFKDASFDEVFSIYGIGWSKNIQKTLSEIYRVLKPGGIFTFSWDHYLARVIEERDGKIFFQNSYNTERPTIRYNWNQTGYNIQSFQARPSTWFALLQKIGFHVTAFYEIDSSKDTEKQHMFSNTYSITKLQYVPSTIIFQTKKN